MDNGLDFDTLYTKVSSDISQIAKSIIDTNTKIMDKLDNQEKLGVVCNAENERVNLIEKTVPTIQQFDTCLYELFDLYNRSAENFCIKLKSEPCKNLSDLVSDFISEIRMTLGRIEPIVRHAENIFLQKYNDYALRYESLTYRMFDMYFAISRLVSSFLSDVNHNYSLNLWKKERTISSIVDLIEYCVMYYCVETSKLMKEYELTYKKTVR